MAYNSRAMVPAPVSPAYCVPYVAQFVIDQKALSLRGGRFVIHDANGTLLFNVNGRNPLALKAKRVLCDASGTPVLLMQRKIMTLHDRWEVYRGDHNRGGLLFSMARSALFQLTPSYDIFLAGNNSSRPDFTVKGDFLRHNYSVLYNGATVAEAREKWNVGSLVGINHYSVTVFPGVDHAFIASLIVIIDQVKQEDSDDFIF